MAVCDLTDLTMPNIDDVYHPGSREISRDHLCFGCGQTISKVAVYWWGSPSGASILLHAECAKQLGTRLIADGIKASEIKRFGPGAAGIVGVVPSLR